MSKYEKAELTNMCMIYDGAGRVVVQDKVGKNWGGITFPGGHVEKDESFVDSVIREVKEETGLDIQSPKLCGIKWWEAGHGRRYIILLFKTDRYTGTLHDSNEGKAFCQSCAPCAWRPALTKCWMFSPTRTYRNTSSAKARTGGRIF